ncbi:MAG: Ig-like domain-containing protein [Acidobacteriota bacterium]
MANGVFTVNDGNLVVNGVVNCNDDTTTNACAMAFNVSGNLTVNTTGALYAENRSGSGVGGAITLTVGGSLTLNGNAIVSTASKSSSGSNGGAITANASGGVTLGAGSTIDSGSANAAGGAIAISSGSTVTVNGNVLSGPSRTLLSTRFVSGAALDGGTGNTVGGSITIGSSTFVEPAVVVGSTANIVSQGADSGAGPVTIDGCGIQVRGLIAALSQKDGAGRIRIRSGKDVLVDGRDLGATGTRMGRLRADAPSGTAANKGVDIFAGETIDLLGPAAGTIYVVTSVPGIHDAKSYGGLIRVTSLGDAVNGSGKLIDDGHSASGDTGGTVQIAAKGDVTLNTAEIRAHGDFNTGNSNRGGGSISIRSHSGNVVWTNGVGEVRPVGSTSGLAPADQGKIVINACGTINTAGTSFPVEGVATSPLPETHTGVCSPAAPSLPVGVPPLVTCNTPPVANNTSATTNEDTTVTITLSGSDADGDSLTFTIVSGPANGSLGPIISTGPTTATVDYTPNLDYNGGDSFVFRANDGNGGTDDATATITIAPVNDPPSFQAGPTVSVLEDSGAQTYTNWATAIAPGPADESGQTVTFTVTNDNPSLFSVQPALSSNGTLTFTPAANAYGSATITVTAQDNGGTANGGDDTSNPQTSAINVTPVNDEPSFVAGPSQTVNEDAGAQSVANWATAISAGPNEGGQTVTFHVSSSNPSLFSAGPSVSSNGTLTYTPAANANGSATVSVYVTDDGGTANGGDDTSGTQTFTITVNAVNDEPSFTSGGNVSVLEDSGAYSAAWATAISAGPADESGQATNFNTSNDNNALFSAQPAVASNGTLTFTPAANASGSATVTVTLFDNGGTANGGDDTAPAQTFVITVDPVNDEPSFTAGGDVTVNEDSGAYSAAWASAISAGPGEGGQTLTFVVTSDDNALFAAQPAISASGVLTFTPAANAFGTTTVTVYLQDDGGTSNGGDDTSGTVTFQIVVNSVNDAPSFVSGGNVAADEDSGAYSGPWATSISAGPANESGQSLTFAITGNSNPALFAAGPSIAPDGTLTFTSVANAFGSANITVTLSDDGGTANGGANTSAPVSFTITVNSVNDPPSFTAGGNVTVNEDSGAYLASWATAISAGPGESQPLTFTVTNDNNALFSVQPSISPVGVLSFTTAPNAFGTANVTVTLSDGIDSTAPVSFIITVNGTNDPPSAGNDTWETEGNTELRVDVGAGVTPNVADTTPSGKGVADNDADTVEGDPFTVTGIVGCGDVVSPYVCAVTGGTVTMNSNGSFSFQPAAGATSASFQYEVTDQPAAGAPASAIGSVTITIHDMIWYVNGAAAPGNGTSAAPFSTFAALNGLGDIDGFGDYIFVHTSALAGSIALEGGQRLWGQGIGLIIPRNLNGNGFPTTLVAPGIKPTVTQAVGDVVTVSGVSGVEIAGLSLAAPAGSAIDVTSAALGAAAGATIYSNTITAGNEGIEINANAALGTSAVIDNTSIVSAGNGVDLQASDGNVTFAFTNGSVLSTGGSGIVANGASADILFVSGLSNVTIDGNTAGDGIVLTAPRFDANPGTVAIDTVNGGTISVGSSGNPVGSRGVVITSGTGSLAFGALNAYASTNGVSITSGVGGMTVTSTSGTIAANAGVGLSVTGATIGAANLTFTSISAAGAANGILLNNTGATGGLKVVGTGSANSGGTIQNTTSHGVSLTNTNSPAFNWVRIQNTAGSGVKGTTVNGFAFADGSIDNSGTALGVDDSNIAFNTLVTGTENNLSGTVSIVRNQLTNAYYHGVDLRNGSGTIADVTVSNNTITSTTSTATSKGSAIRLIAIGSAGGAASVTKGSLSNNIITNFPSGAGILAQGGNATLAGPASTFGLAGNAANVVTISGNRIAGNAAQRMGTNAIVTGVNGKGQGNFDISGNGTVANPITNISGTVIINSALGQSTVTSRIANNVIVANHIAGFGGPLGISAGAAQTFTIADAPQYTVEVSGNQVSAVDGNGILVTARSSAAIMKARVLNNVVAAPLSGFRQGIRVDSGTATGNTNVCLEITGNTSAGAGGALGIGLRKQGTSPAVNVFGVVGMVATSTPGVELYVDSLNPAGGGTELVSATSGFTGCSLP